MPPAFLGRGRVFLTVKVFYTNLFFKRWHIKEGEADISDRRSGNYYIKPGKSWGRNYVYLGEKYLYFRIKKYINTLWSSCKDSKGGHNIVFLFQWFVKFFFYIIIFVAVGRKSRMIQNKRVEGFCNKQKE